MSQRSRLRIGDRAPMVTEVLMGFAAGRRTIVYILTTEEAPTFAAIRSPKSRGRIPRTDVIIAGGLLREPE